MSNITQNDKDLVYNLFSQIMPMEQNDFVALTNKLKKACYKKGDTLLELRQIESKISFVLSGIVHMYCLIDGETFTINIALPGMLFNALSSYVNAEPSTEIHKAVTDTELVYLNKADSEFLVQNNHIFAIIFAKLYEHVLLERENRTLLLQYKSSHKRYAYFVNTMTNASRYLQEVPQKLVAQYLGLAPETFCRVKAQYLGSKSS